MKISPPRQSTATDRSQVKFYALTCFAIIVFLTGGSARADVLSLAILRPAALLFGVYAITSATLEDLNRVRAPLVLLGCLGALMALQLVPLPHAVWSSLPDREAIARTDVLLGFGDNMMRPLSFTPALTLNSLFSLSIPFAALILLAIQNGKGREKIWTVILILTCVSAGWGMLQLGCGDQCVFYTYRISNFDSPVGALANRNHQAVFLSSGLLIAAWKLRAAKPGNKRNGALAFSLILAVIILLLGILLSGSRAGLIACGIALLGSVAIALNAPILQAQIRIGNWLTITGKQAVTIGATIIAVLSMIIVSTDATTGLSRLAETDSIDEIRWKTMPTIWLLAKDHFIFGSGFGSFDHLYRFHELDKLLGQRYLNQAHNDWIQLLIEGGLAAAAITLLSVLWLFKAAVSLARQSASSQRDLRLAACGIIALFGLASAVDYPLRTPIGAMMMALAAATVALPPRNAKPG